MSDETLRNAAVTGAATNLEGRWFAIGSDASTQASNERLQPDYGTASGSAADITTLSFTGTGSASVSHLLVYAADTGGSVQFAAALSGDLAFNAEGDLDLTSAALTVADA
jgi:hypothetical protein